MAAISFNHILFIRIIQIINICRGLSISRTPAREALIKLASDNLIEYSPRRGFFVKELSIKEKLDIYSVIGCLDGFAAASAVNKMTEDDLRKMAEIKDKKELEYFLRNIHWATKYLDMV